MNVFRRELREGRRGLLGWTIGVAAAVLLYMPFYPSVGGPDLTQTYIDMFPPELADLLGLQGLASGPGYAQSTYFGLLGFLLIAIAAIGWGSRAIAGAEDSGTLELTLAHAVARGRVVLEASLALLTRVAVLCAVGSLLLLALNGPAQLEIEPANLLAATIALFLLTSLTGAAALLGGALTGRPAVATGFGAFVAVAAYVLDAVARMAGAPWLARLSPYHWAYGSDPITTGFDAGALLALVAAIAALVLLSGWRFSRRDVGTA